MDETLVRQYPELELKHFWWVTRRLLVHRLISTVRAQGEMDVLDIGCGSGVLARELAQSGAAVTASDLIPHPDWSASRNPRFVAGDYLGLSTELGVHDVVLALDVMEHFEDDRAFADHLMDNVRPGGSAIVTVPAYKWLWSRHDEVNHHFRRYTRATLRQVITGAGLEVSRCGYIFFGLIAPKLLVSVVGRGSDRDEIPTPAPIFNETATKYFQLEHRIAITRRNFLPAGTSVLAVCRRPFR